MRGYNPADIVTQIKTRRVSVLVSVPKILDVLREHVLRVAPEAATPGPKQHVAKRWWRYRHIHRLFGLKFWSFVVGAAPLEPELEAFWSELGFVVIQGYGLTETAPIVSLNHPFGTKKGSVGKAIAGVEVKIAADGEILVRGENVTSGYFNAAEETARAFEDGWFHTGDIGEIAADGQMFIRGRKKEMIVTPEGLNVFPEDVERVLNHVPGVRDSAVVGVATGGEERVHAVLVVEPGVDPDAVARAANAELDDHQKIRRAVVWPEPELPRTEGTRKLKRAAIREWLRTGAAPRAAVGDGDKLSALVAKYAGRADLSPTTTLEELGLSSLERVELMVALEDAFQTHLDEGAFAGVRDVGQLRTLVERASTGDTPPADPVDFPTWNRSLAARAVRRINLPTWILPLARVFAWLRIEGLEHLRPIRGPVIFAANHQSHMDGPVILAALPARWRYRLAPAMAKEFFKAHFFPRAVRPRRAVHEQPELLPRRAVLQRLPAAAARSGRAADAALHRPGARRRLFGADLSGRQAHGSRRDRSLPSGHRHDRVAARRAGRPGAPRGPGQACCTTPGAWRGPAARVSRSARRSRSPATITKRWRSRSESGQGL